MTRLIPLLFLLVHLTPPTERTYYVSVGGNDARDGLTRSTAWRSIARLNTINFRPGDRIRFEGGQTFEGHLQLDGADAGTPESPVVIESYGPGVATLLSRDTSAITVLNAGGIAVRRLTLSGQDRTKNRGYGLQFINRLPNADKRRHVRIDSVRASAFGRDGIFIGGSPADSSQSGYDDVQVRHCELFDNQYHGLYVTGVWDTHARGYANRNLRIDHCQAHDNTGDPLFLANHSGSGMEIDDVEDAVIEHCAAYNNGYLCNARVGGPCGIWLHAANRAVIQHCVAINNRTGRGLDGAGFDLDGGTTNCIIQYCYARDNDGAGILIWNYENAPHTLENNVLRFNILENNGRRNDYADIHIGSGGTPVRHIRVHNNTIATSRQPGTNAAAFRLTYGPNEDIRVENNVIITNGCADTLVMPQNKRVVFARNWLGRATDRRPYVWPIFTQETPALGMFAALRGYRPVKPKPVPGQPALRDFAGQPAPAGLIGAMAK